jgi:hypothetical protein
MYIGEFEISTYSGCWKKNTTYPVTLYKPGEDGALVVVQATNGGPKIVYAMNAVGTFGYKSAALRYVSIVEINETYWVVSAEC